MYIWMKMDLRQLKKTLGFRLTLCLVLQNESNCLKWS